MSEKSDLVFAVTEAEFESKVIARSHEVPVVVDFWAPWCGPCRGLAPVLEAMVQKRAGTVLLAKVNSDEEQGLAAKYGINVLPTVVAFRAGKPLLSFEGLLPESQLSEFLDRIVPTDADRKAREAADLEKTNAQQAEKLYRLALKQNPDLEEAILGLARVLIDRHQDGVAAELIERIGSGGEHGAEAERLGAVLWLKQQAQIMGDERTLRERLEIDQGNAELMFELGTVLAGSGKYEEALKLLLQAAEKDRKLASNKVRETMVKVFHVVGVRSELADDYRRKLSAVLY